MYSTTGYTGTSGTPTLFLAVDYILYNILLSHVCARFSVRTFTPIRYDGTRAVSLLLQMLCINEQQVVHTLHLSLHATPSGTAWRWSVVL